MTNNCKRNPNVSSDRPRYARLSPFEEYMVRDERRGFPMTQEMQWRFNGSFDPELLQRAFWAVVAVEPLCGATVRRRFGRYYWDLDSKTKPEFEITNRKTNDFVSSRSGHIRLSETDITKQPGFRVRIEREAPALHHGGDGFGRGSGFRAGTVGVIVIGFGAVAVVVVVLGEFFGYRVVGGGGSFGGGSAIREAEVLAPDQRSPAARIAHETEKEKAGRIKGRP